MDGLEPAAAAAADASPRELEWVDARADSAAASVRRPPAAVRTAASRTAASRTERTAAGTALRAAPVRAAASAGADRLLVDEYEGPFVVMIAPLVQANRFSLALASHADHSARHHAARCAQRAGRLRRAAERASGGTPAARLHGLPRRTRLRLLRPAERLEVVVRNRVLVFLADEVSIHERVESGRKRSHLGLVQANRANVLLAAEDELFFLLALGLVPPHGQYDRHQDRHHRQRHQQRGHRVTVTILVLTP
jgi:hypothetical protein